MKQRFTFLCTFLLTFSILSISSIYAQAITTAAINGKVVDKAGKPLQGATIQVKHEPSGTKYGNTTRAGGLYNVQNLRVGGPYTVQVSFVGFASQTKSNLYLELGQNFQIDFVLLENTTELGQVVITGDKNAILSSSRTGAQTTVSKIQIESFPTVARSFQDFSKFTPQFSGAANNANSAAGRNNRFNNIQIDGTSYNDLFGLAANGTPGGQASTNPISLDAIDQFQVVIAPYDVRQGGFTGGGINAITRGGTNKFSGSVYAYGRNENFVGYSPDTLHAKYAEFKEYQTGIRLGGPIIEDKLFFFVNAELTKRTSPLENIAITQKNSKYADSMASIRNIAQSKYGYNPGEYGAFTQSRPSTKLFFRFDFNISDQHKLTLRHNFVDAQDDNIPRNISTLLFSDRNYVFNSTTNSTVLQLNSVFGSDMSNEFTLGFTAIRDKRKTDGSPFPSVSIYFDNKAETAKLGTEEFSIRNKLDQNIFEITDNFSYFMGKHAFTIGTHNEFFSFDNLYIRDYYGNYIFNSIADFQNAKPYQYTYSYAAPGKDPDLSAKWSAAQFGFYIQDEWSGVKGLKLTAGLRIDIPTYFTTPAVNDTIVKYFALNTDKLPKSALLFSPRIGFNYDPIGDRDMQFRGGIGIFTGRVPFVWISNQYGNTGVDFLRLSITNPAFAFYSDPLNQPKPGMANPPAGLTPQKTSEVDLTDPDFKMPQLMRINFAVDKQLPFSFVGTLEGIYSKSLNDLYYQDINLGPQTKSVVDGRPYYASTAGVQGKVSQAFTNVLLMKNTSDGYQYNISASLQRQLMDNWSANLAYTYGRAKDRNSTTSSQAYSQYRYNPIQGNPNNPDLTTSNFEIKHRIMAAVSYTFNYLGNYKTTVSLFYNGQSGRPFSYIYTGDANGDGQTGNDLIYIPTDHDPKVNLTSNNWDALNKYISNDDYLKDNRGKIAERNGAREPWVNQLDLHISQLIPVYKEHTIEINLDILNVQNLIDREAGWVKSVPNQTASLLTFSGYDATSGVQKVTFNDKVYASDPYQNDALYSRWQMQLGLRYSF